MKYPLNKVSIIDITLAVFILIISIFTLVSGIILYNTNVIEDAEGEQVLGAIIGEFFVLIFGILIICIGVIIFILFIGQLFIAINTVKSNKLLPNLNNSNIKKLKVGAIFNIIYGILFLLVFVILLISSLSNSEVSNIILSAIPCVLTFISSILLFISANKKFKTIKEVKSLIISEQTN